MKSFTIFCCLCAAVLIGNSQNLVQNFSFETFSTCPNTASQLTYAVPWNNSQNSPEYLNSCSSSIYSDVPTNYFGFQNAATGQAYGGGLFYGSFLSTYLANIREFLYVPLTTPLSIGTTYYLQFKINLVDNSNYAVNRMGMQFCSSFNSAFPINNTAHLYSPVVISDKVNWTTVTGSFVPSVAYNAVMVGNFFDDANTTAQFVGSSTSIGYNAYYFVDDVVVTTTPLVLPIEWLHASAEVNGRLATLDWEINADELDHFVIENSEDGYTFAEGQHVRAIDGKLAYRQVDTMHSHLPTTFYRIRAIGHNGEAYLSPIIEAHRYAAGIDFLLAYPSPVRQGDPLTVEYNSSTGEAVELSFFALDGKLVHKELIAAGDPGHHELKLSVSRLAAGAYLLKAGGLTQKVMVTD